MTDLDPRALRDAFGAFLTGVTVVATLDDDGAPVGFTANSFASVSLDPPLLLVCPARRLSTFPIFASCRFFAVSVLAEGQEEVSNTFAGYKGDRFARVDWTADDAGAPLIDGAAAQFSCQTRQAVPAGDHIILLGEVSAFARTGAPGLGYASGRYVSLGLERDAAAQTGRPTVVGAIIERNGSVLLERTPDGLRPPQITLERGVGVRASLDAALASDGLDVALGEAYSIFDDRNADARAIYFHARANTAATGGRGVYVPIATLADAPIAGAALQDMLRRFALESETRRFGLYLGDESAGDVHV